MRASNFREGCLFWHGISVIGVAFTGLFALLNMAQAHPLTTVYDFCSVKNCKDGAFPNGLVMDQTGNVFGIAGGGGVDHHSQGNGTVFELKNGKKFKLLYKFCTEANCLDGSGPVGNLVIDTSGNLYGTTLLGGAHGQGTAFELSPTAHGVWSLHKLYDFCSGGAGCPDGGNPSGALTYVGASTGVPYDGSSPLYGVGGEGGTGGNNALGVVFQLTPPQGRSSWSETVLYSFCIQGGTACTDGARPLGALLADANGNLFGVTSAGGVNHPQGFSAGAGVVFQLRSNTGVWNENVIYNFCSQQNCSDGAYPSAGLIEDSNGDLLGTTFYGGANCLLDGTATSCGTIFQLTPDGANWQQSVLHTFCLQMDCPDGAGPTAPLLMGPGGALYSTTKAGGGNDGDPSHEGGGVLFKVDGASFEVVHSFCALANCADGFFPFAGVVLTGSGLLLGSTEEGGNAFSGGTVFKIKP